MVAPPSSGEGTFPESRQFLALCTHTAQLQIALGNPHSHKQETWELGRQLGQYIHTHLQTVMQGRPWSSLNAIGVATGTGDGTSYTGMRIGLTIARTLGQQLNLPVYTVNNPDSAVAILQVIDREMALGKFPHWSSALPIYKD